MKNSKNVAGLETLESCRLSQNSGQALIEYVLMLIITVSLVLALIAQVFKPFQTFVQSYMGDYVQCLLETGELPFSAGDQPSTAGEEGCAAKFGSANWNNNANAGNGSGGDKNKDAAAAANSSNQNSSSGSSGGSTYAGSASRNGRSYFSAPRSAPRGVSDGGGNSKVIEIALDGGGAGGFFKGSTGGGYTPPARKVRAVGITGISEEEIKKLAKKADGSAKVSKISDGRMPASKKTQVKKPEAKADFIPDDEPMTIGNFIRFLFIAALVIALLLFIGGQALQMSKSFEK